MTPEERKRLAALVGMLDSDQVGEREAALGKVHAQRAKLGWPGFADLWRRAEDAVSKEDFEKVEQNLAQWMRAHDERVTEIAARDQRIAALRVRIAGLRSALFFMVHWRMMAGVVVVAAGCSGGWWWWSKAQAAPDQQPVAAAEDTARAAVDAALRDVLDRTPWRDGENSPVVVMVGGVPYWVVVRGNVDAQSHADAQGRTIERHCLKLFASEAMRDAGAFVTPSPYLAFGQWMKWPQRAAACRMPGTRNYS